MTLQRDMKDMIEPIDKHEPIDNSDPAHAIEPTERTEPTDATDSTDPFEAIDNTESSDHRDHLELSPARRIHGMLRPRTMRGSPRGLAAVPVESGVCHRREASTPRTSLRPRAPGSDCRRPIRRRRWLGRQGLAVASSNSLPHHRRTSQAADFRFGGKLIRSGSPHPRVDARPGGRTFVIGAVSAPACG